MIFRYGAGAVGRQKIHQIIDLALKQAALVGFADLHAVLQLFKNQRIAGDIPVVPDGVLLAGEGLVGHDTEMPGAEDQRIARNAGGGLISLAEAAVDDDELAAALDGTLALFRLDRHMTVDDVAVLPFQAEFLQKHSAGFRIMVIGIIGILRFRPGGLIRDETALKGGHPVTAEDRAVAAGPEPPEEVHTELPLRCSLLVIIGFSGCFFRIIQEFLTLALPAADGEAEKLAVGGHGNTAVEQKIAVMDLIQAALGIEETGVTLELLGMAEGIGELIDNIALFLRQTVGIRRIHRGEIAILQRIFHAADGDGLPVIVDAVQQRPVLHTVLRAAQHICSDDRQ